LTAATSDEDDRRQTRQEIIRSFLDGERFYVMLLGCLVEVSFHWYKINRACFVHHSVVYVCGIIVNQLYFISHYSHYRILRYTACICMQFVVLVQLYG